MNFEDENQPKKVEDFELFGGTKIEIKPFAKKYLYIFKDEGGNELFQRTGDIPARVTEQSEVGKEIKRLLDPSSRLQAKALKEDYLLAMQALQEYWKDKKQYDEQQQNNGDEEKELKLQESIEAGIDELNRIKSPLLWVASLTDWYAAGERMNILYAWIAYCCQVLLHEPITVIVEGEAGKGKSKIQESALSMIPEEDIETIKSATEAALYGFADKDPWYFNHKIVNMTDMGEKSDHEEAEFFKKAMKELQTDGDKGGITRIKQVPSKDGGFENQEYHLYGRPCLTYTNVPNYQQGDQELSRGLLLRPRKDHERAFMIFKRLNKQKNTPSANFIKTHIDKQEIVRNMVEAIRDRLKTVAIYNPYWSFMEEYLGKSKYLFRDSDKYDGILRVITAINGYNRKIFDIDGQKTLFTTREDISFFLELLEQYHQSIVSNLAPGASELLNDLKTHKDEWFDDDERTLTPGITINTFCELSKTTLARNTVQKYFKDLENAGYIVNVTPDKREKHFNFGRASKTSEVGHVCLTDLDRKIMEFNYGSYATETFEKEENYGVSLKDNHPEILEPYWNQYLPEKQSS